MPTSTQSTPSVIASPPAEVDSSAPAALTAETIRSAPKVLLHDHLDGGVRPVTLIELSELHGYGDLPSHDPVELARWFSESAYSGSLERYLETFTHTVGVFALGRLHFVTRSVEPRRSRIGARNCDGW